MPYTEPHPPSRAVVRYVIRDRSGYVVTWYWETPTQETLIENCPHYHRSPSAARECAGTRTVNVETETSA